ncbi:hypothetical protein [Vulcanisaeta sp. JCM 14467]|nr:hypothetical protein [Vulcanisaeta sp. JCM 14467]
MPNAQDELVDLLRGTISVLVLSMVRSTNAVARLMRMRRARPLSY